ncbi:hypothetical protein EV12_0974 [Prochlorococcus sp. MIT 0701]|nr:hypothetical protein EV12_0974 [Prochlorococcus sp. MIT 0701]
MLISKTFATNRLGIFVENHSEFVCGVGVTQPIGVIFLP